jgi:hypothetical protein
MENQKKENLKKENLRQEKINKTREHNKKIFNQVFNSAEGKEVLSLIKNELCPDTPFSFIKEDKDIALNRLVYFNARREAWLNIRSLIKDEILKEVEYAGRK